MCEETTGRRKMKEAITRRLHDGRALICLQCAGGSRLQL